MTAGFKIGPILNPDQVISNVDIEVRVLQPASNNLYVEGIAQISVKAKGD
jgi:hypothetical protein